MQSVRGDVYSVGPFEIVAMRINIYAMYLYSKCFSLLIKLLQITALKY